MPMGKLNLPEEHGESLTTFRQNVSILTPAPDANTVNWMACGQIRFLRTEPGVGSSLGAKGMD